MTVPIVFIADENFIIPTCVAISSLISSKNQESIYDIYVICTSISEYYENTLLDFSTDTAIVHIIQQNADRFSSLHTFIESSDCVASTSALFKFILPDLLPEYDKVLYLDGDVLVRIDLTELYSTEIGNDLVAAVIDSGTLYSKQPYISKVEHYFNSGVMLLNLSQMRKENTSYSLIMTKKNLGDSKLMDQNIFNLVFDHRIKTLPIKYNFLAVNLLRAINKWSLCDLNDLYNTDYDSIDELFDSWSIVHFSSKDKPWKNPFTIYSDSWFDTYRQINNKDFFKIIPDYKHILKSNNITVAITSHPDHINSLPEVIDCLISQTYSPDRIVIFLPISLFPNREESLPPELLESINNNDIILSWCPLNLNYHTAYYYSMYEYPDDVIIIYDDNKYIPNNSIEILLNSWLHFPNSISAQRINLITFDHSGNMVPYADWVQDFNSYVGIPSIQFVAINSYGVLYPPHLLSYDLFDINALINIDPYDDDLWLKLNEVLTDIPVVLASNDYQSTNNINLKISTLYKQHLKEGDKNELFESLCEYLNNKYNTKDLIQSKLNSSAIGVELIEVPSLSTFINNLQDNICKKDNLILRYKNDIEYINDKLQATYAEKSDINAKLQITYQEKASRGTEIKDLTSRFKLLEEENEKLHQELNSIHSSHSYKLGRIITSPIRWIKHLLQ